MTLKSEHICKRYAGVLLWELCRLRMGFVAFHEVVTRLVATRAWVLLTAVKAYVSHGISGI